MMSSKENDEWEEEETLVMVELSGILETDFLQNVKGDCSVLGIDTDKPLLQLDAYSFTGEFEDSLGTCLLFEDKAQQDQDLPEGPEGRGLEYFCKVDKKLTMVRAFVKPKEDENAEKASQTVSSVLEKESEDESDKNTETEKEKWLYRSLDTIDFEGNERDSTENNTFPKR